MTQARASSFHPAIVDVAVAMSGLVVRRESSPVNAEAAWAPSGYDATDVRVLEWIASHRRGPAKAWLVA